jgi:hypothetical protein
MQRIGYDFDGIFHKNIREKDGLGERHHINNVPLTIYYEIIHKIKQDKANNNEVYVISRGEGDRVRQNIDEIFKNVYSIDIRKDFIKDKNIITDLYKKNIHKSKIIKELGINEFYDDSEYNIHEINRERKKGNLDTKLILVNPDVEEQKEIKKDNLKILSYNVNWKHMLGREDGQIKECSKKDLCAGNINKLILDELPLDFILLQECANFDVLLDNLDKEYHIIKSKSDKEYIITCVNKKYKVTNKFGGKFESGRPFLVVFLEENICIVNLHMAHDEEYMRDLKIIEDRIYIKAPEIDISKYRIILGGDFNEDIGLSFTFLNNTMYNTKKNYSCCIFSTHMFKNKKLLQHKKGKNIDHILDSKQKPIYSITLTPLDGDKLIPGSDHLALYTELIN